jgi:hypothetical protein
MNYHHFCIYKKRSGPIFSSMTNELILLAARITRVASRASTPPSADLAPHRGGGGLAYFSAADAVLESAGFPATASGFGSVPSTRRIVRANTI